MLAMHHVIDMPARELDLSSPVTPVPEPEAGPRVRHEVGPHRPTRDIYFNARAVKLMRLFHDELALLAGNVLSDGLVDPLVGLSPRLRRTLACLLAGLSEKEAALRLGISRHTVHEYVVSLYQHFRVNSRAELMALCMQRRITKFLEAGETLC